MLIQYVRLHAQFHEWKPIYSVTKTQDLDQLRRHAKTSQLIQYLSPSDSPTYSPG